jgi:hypothetical protein
MLEDRVRELNAENDALMRKVVSHERTAKAWKSRDPGRVSRAIKHGEKLDDEAHGRLVVLVAEIERMTPA